MRCSCTWATLSPAQWDGTYMDTYNNVLLHVFYHTFFHDKTGTSIPSKLPRTDNLWSGLRKSLLFCFEVRQGILTGFYQTLVGTTAFGDIFLFILNLFLICPQMTSQEKSEKFDVPRSQKCHSDKHKDVCLKKALIYFRSFLRGSEAKFFSPQSWFKYKVGDRVTSVQTLGLFHFK